MYLYNTPVAGQAPGRSPPTSLLYHLLLGCLATEQDQVAHPYHSPCCYGAGYTTDQLHQPIATVYKHTKSRNQNFQCFRNTDLFVLTMCVLCHTNCI